MGGRGKDLTYKTARNLFSARERQFNLIRGKSGKSDKRRGNLSKRVTTSAEGVRPLFLEGKKQKLIHYFFIIHHKK